MVLPHRGIKSQKLKYANALAGLPKQVLWDILDTFDVCNDSAKPFNLQGLKPSVLMGKLKQYLPPGVSPDNNLFLSMFLIRLPLSMRETVRAGTHGTAAAMVKAADALWDAQVGHDPMVAATLTQPLLWFY